jgi:hydrogenase maturation protease
VDAAKTGRPPGTLVILSNDEVPVFFRNICITSSIGADRHSVPQISDVSPLQITLIGVEPLKLNNDIDLFDMVTRQIDTLAGMVM